MGLSTQDFLQFDQIRDGILILKDKALRGILMVSSLNFALKSQDEQNAILYQFQNFLNSLDFSTQILIQSRRLNITGYLEKLGDIATEEPNELLQLQIQEYRDFVENIVGKGAIMQKSFYVVVPFSISETRGTGAKKRLAKPSALTEASFQRARSQLKQRIEFVALGLRGAGLDAVPLNTPEIIELLWSLYHPGEAEQGYYPELPPELLGGQD